MRHCLYRILSAAALAAMLTVPASAMTCTVDAPADYPFGKPTSQETVIRESEPANADRSKNVSLIPPGFGTPTSYLPNSGEYLTPNLVPGAFSGGLTTQVNGGNASVSYSSASAGITNIGSSFSYTTTPATAQTTCFTEVTSDLYYSNGSLGTLSIPAIGLSVKVVQGTDSGALAKGAGHFSETSIWSGNVAIAAHNRGVNAYFGKIHTLSAGDIITLTTKLGTRNYAVTSVEKISETDSSGTAATSNNQITLYTCVRNESAYRWCVKGVEI